ncbi:MAG: serine hydrolase domain-containing protein, partial [Bacteroidota bacterium]
MSRIAFIVVLMLYVAQTPITGQSPRPITKPFEQELKKWMDYFHIPGLAVGVKKGEELIYENYFGHANIATKQKVQATTVFPIASVTKTLTVLTILNLVEEGTLSLNASILDYLPQSKLPESVQVQHLLSHTSEGIPGETYIYSTRIGLLKSIVEQVTAQTFEEYIQENLLDKLGLASTHFLTENTIAALGDTLAKPYFFFGSTEPGIYEPGFSVTSGLAMTMRDLMRFDRMLDNGTVCSKSMKSKAFTPFQSKKGEAFPYGLGIFVQDIGGASVVWSYGQYDCFSSLYLKVPDSDLTLVLLANNNLMSDPARLINGDIRYSLFARTFFRHFLQEDGATKQAWMSRATQKGEG